MSKRQATPRQLANLARGRQILFQNQLRQSGINPRPQPQIIREIVRQPVVNQITTHQHNVKIQLSLFEKFLGTKFFPIEINNNKEYYNLKELFNHIFTRLFQHRKDINTNQSKISEIIDYLNFKEKENKEKFENLQSRISELESENDKLKKRMEEQERK